MASDIIINFMSPGLLDFGVVDNGEDIDTTGHGPVGLGDLQVDRDTNSGRD